MTGNFEIKKQAKRLTREQRAKILKALAETQLHVALKELFSRIDPQAHVEITHGRDEYGKDLVLVRQDPFQTRTIAVVVKMGDISGRTRGHVDQLAKDVNAVFSAVEEKRLEEIESQVKQAVIHPAETKAHINQLKVDEVWVFLAGDLSNNARRRLEREIDPRVRVVRDMDWLVENFSEHYPQVFFDGRRTDFLQHQISKLETHDWFVRSGKSLSDYFIDPIVSTVELPDTVDSEQMAKFVNRRRLPFSSLTKALKNKRFVILAGDPGTGKSAALAKLAVDMYRTAYNQQATIEAPEQIVDIPVYISAKEVLAITSAEEVKEKACSGFGEMSDRVRVTALLVDGLDEVTPEHRLDVIERARELSKHSSCSLVITSRNIDAISQVPLGFDKYEILPFEVSQALKLFERLMSGNKEMIAALRDSLSRIKFQIPIVPLSLLLLMELAQNNHEVPASITELYDRFVDAVLGRHDLKKGLASLFDYRVKRMFLADLAYAKFYSSDTLSISRGEFDEFANEHATRHSLNRDELPRFLNEIERAGILNAGTNEVEFAHRTFLDYFVASYLHDHQDEISNINDEIVRLHFDGIWNEVAFFFVGLKRKISPVAVEQIFNYEGDDLYTNLQKFMTGRLLQAGWYSESATRSLGIEKSFRLTPTIRRQFVEATSNATNKVPTILSYFYLIIASDYSFRSAFLREEMVTFLDKLGANPNVTADDIRIALPILFVLKPLLSKSELQVRTEKFLDALSHAEEITPEDKASAVTLLYVLHKDNPGLISTLNTKIKRLRDRYPKVFDQMFPEQKAGFRRRSLGAKKSKGG